MFLLWFAYTVCKTLSVYSEQSLNWVVLRSLSPPADRVHAVDGWDPERLVLGSRQAVTERAQTQTLVVTATGTLHDVAHGLSVGRAHGGGEGERTLVHFLRDCAGKRDDFKNISNTITSVKCKCKHRGQFKLTFNTDR